MKNKFKFKLLKEIEILDYKFQITWDKTHSGGSFSFARNNITVGIAKIKDHPEIAFHILLHELSEVIHVLINTRYDDPSVDGNYKFFLDHKEFELHNRLLSQTILKFL